MSSATVVVLATVEHNSSDATGLVEGVDVAIGIALAVTGVAGKRPTSTAYLCRLSCEPKIPKWCTTPSTQTRAKRTV